VPPEEHIRLADDLAHAYEARRDQRAKPRAELPRFSGHGRETGGSSVQAHALFEAKGNLVRAQQVSSRLRELGSG
jgi:hypothetical protein